MKSIRQLFILVILVASCDGTREKAKSETPRSKIKLGDTVYLESGVKYLYMKKGSGDPVLPNKRIITHINLGVDGKIVWTTYEPLRPLEFTYKVQSMIKGFDEVLQYMVSGDQIMAIIPPEHGYGETGSGPDIPPNATLHFDIEVPKVSDK